jgi:hypothetical protein
LATRWAGTWRISSRGTQCTRELTIKTISRSRGANRKMFRYRSPAGGSATEESERGTGTATLSVKFRGHRRCREGAKTCDVTRRPRSVSKRVLCSPNRLRFFQYGREIVSYVAIVMKPRRSIAQLL